MPRVKLEFHWFWNGRRGHRRWKEKPIIKYPSFKIFKFWQFYFLTVIPQINEKSNVHHSAKQGLYIFFQTKLLLNSLLVVLPFYKFLFQIMSNTDIWKKNIQEMLRGTFHPPSNESTIMLSSSSDTCINFLNVLPPLEATVKWRKVTSQHTSVFICKPSFF